MEKGVTTSTDIVIVGGGLVGATLAKALSTLNLRITLIEKSFLANKHDAAIIDQRALALNSGSLAIFKNLLQLDLSAIGTTVKKIFVSDEHGFGRIALDAQSEDLFYFGCIIPILKLTEILQAAVLNDPKITCISGTCTNLIQEQNQVICEINHTERIHAQMVIGADGAHSKVRELMNVDSEVKDYQESALIGNVKIQGVEPHTAFERFTTSGPVALLPFDQEHMTLVWVMPSTLVSMRQNLPAVLLLQDLQKIMGYRAGRFLALGQLQAFPLQQVLSNKTYEGRVGLLGNAAHSLHPVAGQGFNLSMRDIFGFYQTLKRYQDCLSQPEIIWQEYLRLRQHDQARTAKITDVLVQLFTKKNPLVHFTRNALMMNLELCPPAKTALNQVMVGLT